MSTFNPRCGYFASVRGKGSNRLLLDTLEAIRSPKWQTVITTIRTTTDEKAQNAAKTKLPALMLSATTRNGGHKETDLEQHTGLLQCDIDHLESFDAATALRDSLRSDPHAFAAWISPRGRGVKCLLRVPAELAAHRAAFSAAQRWFREHHGHGIDSQCSDPCRLCFVSHDPDLWINPEALEIRVDASLAIEQEQPCAPKPDKLGGHTCSRSATSLPSASASAICTLHNKVFEEFPSLVPFYRNLVQTRFHDVQPGLRNASLCEMVPLLYSAIDDRFIPPFVTEQYDQCRKVFRDPLATHLKEAEALLRGVSHDSATKQLSDDERFTYALCADDRHRCAFRICHALAACESEQCPPPFFFLSAEKLGHRLGCLTPQAWRALKWLESIGIIQTVEKGQRRAHHVVAKATRYRWMLASALVKALPTVQGINLHEP
jgi:hypothetical protein